MLWLVRSASNAQGAEWANTLRFGSASIESITSDAAAVQAWESHSHLRQLLARGELVILLLGPVELRTIHLLATQYLVLGVPTYVVELHAYAP